jgi:hypothetical protein
MDLYSFQIGKIFAHILSNIFYQIGDWAFHATDAEWLQTDGRDDSGLIIEILFSIYQFFMIQSFRLDEDFDLKNSLGCMDCGEEELTEEENDTII